MSAGEIPNTVKAINAWLARDSQARLFEPHTYVGEHLTVKDLRGYIETLHKHYRETLSALGDRTKEVNDLTGIVSAARAELVEMSDLLAELAEVLE